MPIAIVGSGRSGTSMITGMLNRCGLYIGESDDQIARDERNPSGYWEHRQMRELTDQVLGNLTARFGSPSLAPDGWQQDSSLAPLYDQARGLIERSFSGKPIWGWKYPETSLVIPFWREVAPDLRFVICMRNPLDAISSLSASFAYSQSHAGERWMLHVLKALTDTRPEERFVTFYERYFPDFHAELFELLDFTGLPRPASDSEIDRALAGFHRSGLNHYNSSIEDLLATPAATYLMRELYVEILVADRHASDLPILAQAEAYMPLLGKLYAAEEAEHQLQYLQSVLGSRTHRIASAICSALIALRPKAGQTHRSNNEAKPSLEKNSADAQANLPAALSAIASMNMNEKRTAFARWSKNGASGGGKTEISLGHEPCEVCIRFNPVNGTKLWLDLSPAPALIQLHSVALCGADGLPILQITEPGDIRALATGTSSWWTATDGARLMSLGERNILSVDIPESVPPAHAIRLTLCLVDPAGAKSLAEAMGELLNEANREHEGFAQQVDALLDWQREQTRERAKRERFPAGWLKRLRGAT